MRRWASFCDEGLDEEITGFDLADLVVWAASHAEAEDHIKILVPQRFHDITKPRTRAEVREVYRWLVDKKDGVDEKEAKLIAQYEATERKLEYDYDLSKPKVVGSSEKEFKVRLPSRFSLTRPPREFIVCVDKKNGRVTSVKEEPLR